ncbi:MAG TPA: LLM class flavin-dependent oxidoreductase [Acidimicrobiia bacterium]|nr:LLM class flavin-dependent oxidoreductase [Acidimicrobiia bacterium]
MELGITTFAETTPDPVTGEVRSHGERLRQVVAEAELCEAVGLDVFGVGEHHRPDFASSVPAVVLAAIAARTERIRLAPAVVILSSDDPVRVFQQFATLDLLSAGRAELLVGRGSFIESFPLFGYDLADYDELFAEKLDLLIAIRDNERVTWSGKFRPPLTDQAIYPRPQQDPLPIWVGVGGSPESMVRAGLRGLPVALAIIGGIPDRFSVLGDIHRRALSEAGFDPATVPLAVHAHGYVAATSEQAAEEFYPPYAGVMTQLGRERGWSPMTRIQFEGMRGPAGSLVIGDPETVAEKIVRWAKVLGIVRFMLHISVGTMPHDLVLSSIELFGKEVAPRVRQALR